MPDSGSSVVSSAPAKNFALAAGLITLAFALPLWNLIRFALPDEFYSYIPLMPLVSGYLIWIGNKQDQPCCNYTSQVRPEIVARSHIRILAAIILVAGGAALAGYFFIARSQPAENKLALSTLSWWLFLTSAGCWFLGKARLRRLAFPFFLLVFMVPLPVSVRDGIETALQHGSAVVADWMFTLAGVPLFRDGTFIQLPGMRLNVAPECSGIHSTWILFITSLIAAFVILRRPRNRVGLCLAVIPLALLRNGFRVFVIGQLCIHIGPHMINSWIHRHGGPVFFLLSLVPLFLLLFFLRKHEQTSVAIAQTIGK